MIIQISSGQGPVECELAVYKLYETLKHEYPDIVEINSLKSRFHDTYNSVLFETEQEVICTDSAIRFERFHCGGKGGQNVNKVETGVQLEQKQLQINAAWMEHHRIV